MAPIAPTTALVSLPNTGVLCYRNSVLHSLLSLDKFVKFITAAGGVTNRPIYHQLLELSRRFRSGDPSIRTTAVDRVWDTICNTSADPTSPVSAETAALRGWQTGDQQDTTHFLEYLLERLCSTEISVDLYEYDLYRRQDPPMEGGQKKQVI